MPHLLAIPTNGLPYPVQLLNEYCFISYILVEPSNRSGGFGIWVSYLNDLLDPQQHNDADIQRQPQSQSQSQSQSQCNGGYLLHSPEHENGHFSKQVQDVDGDVKMSGIFDGHENRHNTEALEQVLDEILRDIG
ncbi:hypothetical protein GX51_00575 [Blastomyces parvus]|uniref:Uncharacterized protein n=1 Tax=Blastomyces parvus TaxID=2060905 RepID=A0A2B7XKL5_9EURO|nr:hypothetical protein GX51_00575 [Blastomyces parvus]